MSKILIVEDEELAIKAITKRILAEGFSIDVARDGDEALEKINESKPDLILLDLIMPKLDGISVLKQLKKDEATKNIPVIILTNLVFDDKKIEEVLKSGNTDYLIKVDHSLNDIVKRIKEKLNI